mgnify:CR=1 FL=1
MQKGVQMSAEQILKTNKMIPVINVSNLDLMLDLARALVKGGVRILEITLRNENAFKAIELVAKEVEGAIVGVGTIKNAKDLEGAIKAGAKFAITPGLSLKLANDIKSCEIPVIPGISTAGELINALDFGYKYLKLFPASAVGGVNLLKAFASPFSEVSFCPTGGIDFNNAKDYLALPNVLCVGSSALCPTDLVNKRDFAQITELAKKSCEL